MYSDSVYLSHVPCPSNQTNCKEALQRFSKNKKQRSVYKTKHCIGNGKIITAVAIINTETNKAIQLIRVYVYNLSGKNLHITEHLLNIYFINFRKGSK